MSTPSRQHARVLLTVYELEKQLQTHPTIYQVARRVKRNITGCDGILGTYEDLCSMGLMRRSYEAGGRAYRITNKGRAFVEGPN